MEPLYMPGGKINRSVHDLGEFEEGYIEISDLRLDMSGKMFVETDSVCKKNRSYKFCLMVTRVQEGLICWYKHEYIPKGYKWKMEHSFDLDHELEVDCDMKYLAVVAYSKRNYYRLAKEEDQRSLRESNYGSELVEVEKKISEYSLDELESSLALAIGKEDYEKASKLRDEIAKRKKKNNL